MARQGALLLGFRVSMINPYTTLDRLAGLGSCLKLTGIGRLLAVLLLSWPFLHQPLAALSPEPGEAGLARMSEFPPHLYGGHNQIFQSVQGADGVMYFTNYGALLTWDGERWGKIPVPGAGFLYGLSRLADGRLVVCGVNTIGIVEPDGAGAWAFRSLVEELPGTEQTDLGEIWDMAVTPEGVYFFTRRRMMRWREGEGVRVWHFETEKMIYGFWSGSAIYVQNLDDGLYRLDGSELTLISEDPLFQKPGPRMLTDWGNGNLLIGTMREGLFLYDGEILEPFAESAGPYLSEATFNRGLRMRNGDLALGTFHGGLVVVGADGRFKRLINEESGLPNNTITQLSEDREGGIWLSLGSGIARVEVDGRITRYDRSTGLPNVVVTGIMRHEGTIYLSSMNGLFRLRPVPPPDLPRWERVPGMEGEVHDLVPIGSDLFATCKGQVLRLGERESEVVWDDFGLLRTLHAMRQKEDHLLIGGRIGLGLIHRSGAGWESAGTLPGLEDHVLSIAEDPAGDIWLGTVFSGAIRIRSPGSGPDWLEKAEIRRYGKESGLSSEEHLNIKAIDGKLVVHTATGPQQYDPETDRFEDAPGQDTSLAPPDGWAWDVFVHDEAIGSWGSVYPIEGAEDDFQLYFGGRTPAGAWQWLSSGPFEESGGVVFMYLESGEPTVMWIGGWSGLLRWEFTGGMKGLPVSTIEAVVRRIRKPDGAVLHAGPGGFPSLSLEHSRESLEFAYAAPVHTPGVEVRYRTQLEGYEGSWSEWGDAAERVFTNLPAGNYRFRVEAKTPSGFPVQARPVAFAVLPPWYQSAWAAVGYLLLAGLLVWGLMRLRMTTLRRENSRLESMVDARTAELAASEEALIQARDAAEFANKQKSRFLANMSHELRTPLNAIMGYAQILDRDPALDERNKKRVSILHTSCNLLVHLINEVLDLSKIEAGRLEVHVTPVRLKGAVGALVNSFGAKAANKGIQLAFTCDEQLPDWVELDIRKVEQILTNLIGNALKFTDSGSVAVRAFRSGDDICIDVVDTGVGIGPAECEAVFDAFYQTSEGEGNEAGTGLGLAISRKLSEVMGGRLTCSSKVGEGSTFRLELPLREVMDGVPEAETADKMVVAYRGERKTLLVVDDIPANRDIVVELMEPLGFEVKTSGTGAEAVRLCEEGGIDLVLLDLRMSPMSGEAVLKEIRELPGGTGIPVVSYSASLIGFTRCDALAMGCDGWLPKPFRPEDLHQVIEELLGVVWVYGRNETAAREDAAYAFNADDLGQLRALAYRREPAGLKALLTEIREREPESAVVINPLLELVAGFRLGEISDRLDAMPERDSK